MKPCNISAVRIGLASDTFGNVEGLCCALEVFTREQADRIFFLGGRLGDLDAALARRRGGSRDAPVPETDREFLAAVEGALARAAVAREDPLAARLVRVASRACPEYGAGAEVKVMDLVEGRICCLVHDKADLTRDDIGNATILFHGNSGHPALVAIGPRAFVTPGHLRYPAPEGRPATFGLAEVGPQEIALTVYSAQGAELRRERCPLPGGGKVAVR